MTDSARLAPQCVLFDLDMTLVDSSSAITCCLNMAASRFGLDPLERKDVLELIGFPMEQAMEKHWGRFDPEWLAWYRQSLVDIEMEQLAVLPGVVETLKIMHGSGFPMGVVTNRPNPVQVLAKTRLELFFDVVLGANDVERPKPDPDPLLRGFSRLKIEPARGLFVGDSLIDLETARCAGSPFVGVATGNATVEVLAGSGAFAALDGMMGLPGLLGRGGGNHE